MNDLNYIKDETAYLFKYNFDDDSIPEDVAESYEDRAQELIKNYPWATVFDCWFDYLKNNCPTDKDVINWANLFWWYGGADQPLPIENPYEFLGYLHYRVDVTKHVLDAQTIFDSIALAFLEPLGKVSLLSNPSYASESDPDIVSAAQKWRAMEK